MRVFAITYVILHQMLYYQFVLHVSRNQHYTGHCVLKKGMTEFGFGDKKCVSCNKFRRRKFSLIRRPTFKPEMINEAWKGRTYYSPWYGGLFWFWHFFFQFFFYFFLFISHTSYTDCLSVMCVCVCVSGRDIYYVLRNLPVKGISLMLRLARFPSIYL